MSDYPGTTGLRKRSVFTGRLQQALEIFREDIKEWRVSQGQVTLILDQLSRLPVADLVRAGQEIQLRAGLYRPHWEQEASAHPKLLKHLDDIDGLEYLFLFHGNGYLREAALHKLDGVASSAFLFAAIAYRLNDWVEPVRRAAFTCALRVFPQTDPEIIVDAAMVLLNQKRLWERGRAEFVIIDETFSRPDVTQYLVARLKVVRNGAPGRVLIAALADERIDAYLPGLAQDSCHPAVRAVALQTLLKGEAVWPEGIEKAWIDKSMGLSRLTSSSKRRRLSYQHSIPPLITQGAVDRAVSVRKVAMQALVDNQNLWDEMHLIVEALRNDRSFSVRAGIDYILRHQTEKSLIS